MPLRPAVDPFSRRRRVAESSFENPPSFVDQEIADVRVTSVARAGKFRQRDDLARNFFLRPLHSLGDVLDNVPIVIARAERHRRVVAAWVLAKELSGRALRPDEILPAQSPNCPQ